jgi:DNA (cytosine-5)-methyltransferase 1
MQFELFEALPEAICEASWLETMLRALGVHRSPGWPDAFGSAVRALIAEKGLHPIKTLSLFSGGGGLDIAFHDCGFEILEMVEIDERFVQTLKANVKPSRLLEGSVPICIDIRDYVPPASLKVDFIVGGPPCQTFSAAGRRASGVQGIDDPRGTLFEEYVKLLNLLRPKGFLFENVYGITGAQNGQAWRAIQEAFKDAGYLIFFRVLDAADYGVPQHRERLFIVGLQDGTFEFPYPTHGPDSIGQEPYYSAGEAIADIDATGGATSINGRFGHLLEDIPPGLNYSFFTEEMGHPSPVFSWRSKFSDFLYKADPEMPVRTIKAQGGQYTGPFHWENRPFSIPELKRLQTFPDSYEIVGGRQVGIHQIGNSVPPQIGRILALSILNQVMGVDLPFQIPYMSESKQLNFRKRKRLLTERYSNKAKAAIAQMSETSEPTTYQHTKKGVWQRYLTKDFKWSARGAKDDSPMHVSFDLDYSTWDIYAGIAATDTLDPCYTITVSSCGGQEWGIKQEQVRLHALEPNLSLFTGLWKAFEELLSTTYRIADLVQLSGYYQYHARFTAAMSFNAVEISKEPLWAVLARIVGGIGVAAQVSALQLADYWQIDAEDVLPTLRILREVGYEVRNQNTNPQIPEGEYLIPYSFPTLSNRSVQLRKTL